MTCSDLGKVWPMCSLSRWPFWLSLMLLHVLSCSVEKRETIADMQGRLYLRHPPIYIHYDWCGTRGSYRGFNAANEQKHTNATTIWKSFVFSGYSSDTTTVFISFDPDIRKGEDNNGAGESNCQTELMHHQSWLRFRLSRTSKRNRRDTN